jgi:3-hydroxy-3-methylglutaryl CoA synthase
VAGILRYGSYVPFLRLTRAAIGAGKGERAVASYDEDSVSMAVEAARDAVRGGIALDAVLFATLSPPYAEKLNAATIQAALDLPQVSSVSWAARRMGLGALLLGLDLASAGRRALVCAGDVVVGAPGGSRESQGGDAAVAFVTGGDGEAIARLIGRASSTIEILDVWRLPEERFGRQWEERFTADTMAPAIADTAKRALASAGVEPSSLSTVILDGTNARSMAGLPNALGLEASRSPILDGKCRTRRYGTRTSCSRARDVKPGDRISSCAGPTARMR